MNRRAFNLVAGLTIVGGLCNYILPNLTGKTMITKMQVAVIVIGAVGTVTANWIAILLHPPKLPAGEEESTDVRVTNLKSDPVHTEEAKK